MDGLRENRYSYFNPLSLCRERQKLRGLLFCRNQISIHSPSAGRDQVDGLRENRYSYFNPLSLCRERLNTSDTFVITGIFQSTLPLQGETSPASFIPFQSKFQSTLPLQGETTSCSDSIPDGVISIHSPSAGRDSNFAHKTSNIPSTPYAKRQIKELFPTPTQQITTFLTLISSISRCESPCIFMCTSHSH